MIVEMKKVYCVAQKTKVCSVLKALQGLGVVHVEPEAPLVSHDLTKYNEDLKNIEQVLNILSQVEEKDLSADKKDWQDIVDNVLKLVVEKEDLEDESSRRQGLINEWELWGDFCPKDIEFLRSKGLFIEFFLCPASEKKQLIKNSEVIILNTISGVMRCVAISKQKIDIDFEFLDIPQIGLSEMKAAQEKSKQRCKAIEKEIKEYAKYKEILKNACFDIEKHLGFEQARVGMASEDTLTWLKGFCPQDKVDNLIVNAKQEKYGIFVQDPKEDDNTPTLLKNPKWVEIVKPVFDIIDILPGYKEKDISLFFLVFFSLFFGILIGDAGYGSIVLALTFFIHKKTKDKTNNAAIFLLYVLSSATIIWGVLTGTYFGQAWLPSSVKPLLPYLNNSQNMQLLCFFIGAIHLSIAHIWRAIAKFPSLMFLSEVGWLSLIWYFFFLAKELILGYNRPSYDIIFLIIGLGCVILFTKPQKNILKTICAGVGDLLLNVINSFTDVVSYIRLFAVGLATVAVADAANTMALGVGFDNIVSGIITALILVVGHIFNMMLAGMSILVHGLRLNVLEFSGHLGMEWTGVKYNPLRKNKKR